MDKNERVNAFLQELTALSQKYEIYIKGYAVDAPWLFMLDGVAEIPIADDLTYDIRAKRYTVKETAD